MSVSARLRAAMWAKDLTITEVAALFHVARPTMSRVFSGKAQLSLEMAFKFQEHFDLDARALLQEQLEDLIEELLHEKPGDRPDPTSRVGETD